MPATSPSLNFDTLCQRGILEIFRPPSADAPVQIMMVSQVIIVEDSRTQTGNVITATGEFDLTGLYALATQGDVMIASFKAHVKYPYKPVPRGEMGKPALLDADERDNPSLFETRFIPNPDDMVYAFSIFLSYCASHGSVVKILEVMNPPCITTGFLDVVSINSSLVPDASVRQKRQFDTVKDWDFIVGFVKAHGYQYSSSAIWHAFNALGIYNLETELVPLLGMYFIYLQAIRDNAPRIALFKEKKPPTRR